MCVCCKWNLTIFFLTFNNFFFFTHSKNFSNYLLLWPMDFEIRTHCNISLSPYTNWTYRLRPCFFAEICPIREWIDNDMLFYDQINSRYQEKSKSVLYIYDLVNTSGVYKMKWSLLLYTQNPAAKTHIAKSIKIKRSLTRGKIKSQKLIMNGYW